MSRHHHRKTLAISFIKRLDLRVLFLGAAILNSQSVLSEMEESDTVSSHVIFIYIFLVKEGVLINVGVILCSPSIV